MGKILALAALFSSAALSSEQGVVSVKPIIFIQNDRPDTILFIKAFWRPQTVFCFGRPVSMDARYLDIRCAAVKVGSNEVYYYDIRLLKDKT